MITLDFNRKDNTPDDMIASLLTEGECKRFIKELDEAYNEPLSTLQTGTYIRLLNKVQTKIQLLKLHGPA